ncbi:MAG: hypothetical protein ABSA59_14060 [Terriglobia bacterium]
MEKSARQFIGSSIHPLITGLVLNGPDDPMNRWPDPKRSDKWQVARGEKKGKGQRRKGGQGETLRCYSG